MEFMSKVILMNKCSVHLNVQLHFLVIFSSSVFMYIAAELFIIICICQNKLR